MPIELERELRDTAVASIQRYFDQNMEEPIGNIAAGALLGFFLEEIAPVIYNRAVADAGKAAGARCRAGPGSPRGRIRLLAQA